MEPIATTSIPPPPFGTIRHVKRTTTLDLGDYLPYLVNRVGSITADQFGNEALAPHDLSIAMWRVMAALAASGSLRQIDLADLTSIDSSTLSRLVTRLVRMRLVTRSRSAKSSREVAIELSAKGQALVAQLIPIARHYEALAIAGLSREELDVLKRCLRRIYGNMKNRSVQDDG
jgi:MarR family transcriptional regulator, organic hydroperoxide resistance regulator